MLRRLAQLAPRPTAAAAAASSPLAGAAAPRTLTAFLGGGNRRSGLLAALAPFRGLATADKSTFLPMPVTWRNVPPPPGTMPRAERILVDHIGQTFLVHSGRNFKRVKVTMQMVDHKFGEFVPTRKRRPPPVKKKQAAKR